MYNVNILGISFAHLIQNFKQAQKTWSYKKKKI